jgi:hypothetical protein
VERVLVVESSAKWVVEDEDESERLEKAHT